MRMATIATTPLTPRAEAALREFGRACDTACRTLVLAPGDLAILDKRVTAHGRTAPCGPAATGRSRCCGAAHRSSSPTCAARAITALTTDTSSPADRIAAPALRVAAIGQNSWQRLEFGVA